MHWLKCELLQEELGIARKDTLPLEDKKGTGGHVDLNTLDRDKKANNPRTDEFRIAQRNASAHSAWKSMIGLSGLKDNNKVLIYILYSCRV